MAGRSLEMNLHRDETLSVAPACPCHVRASHPYRLSVESLSRLHVRASFELNSGECIALQGASGSGKTMLMRAIADLDPNEGTVKLDGVLRESVPGPVWRRQVTYLASEPGWWADTVQEHFANWDNAQPL